MNNMEQLTMHTPSVTDKNFTTLVQLFPNAVTETIDENGEVVRAIDADVLAQEINSHVVSGKEERYQFTWPDKRKSILLANQPIAATLRPCREESVDFDSTENLYIEGDNLDVLKLLRETYLNRVKMIYIDPPYNTGKDFIYADDFAGDTGEFLHRDGQYDEQGNRLTPNLDSNGRFHTDWLNMIYPRLRVARDLLAEDGVIFISIDDTEIANLRHICDEVFGSSNLVGWLVWQHSIQPKGYTGTISIHHNHILCYQKSATYELGSFERTEEDNKSYSNPDNDPNGPWRSGDVRNALYRPNLIYNIISPSGKVIKPCDNGWRWSKKTVEEKIASGEIIFSEDETRIIRKIYLNNLEGRTPESIWFAKDVGSTRDAMGELKKLFGNSPFDTPKPARLIKRMLVMVNNPDAIVLDYFSGSSSTADAVMQMNAEDGGKRKFIMVQLPEVCPEDTEAAKAGYKNICEIGKERIRRAGRKIKDEAGMTAQNLDIGFRVLKLDSSNMKNVYYKPEKIAQINLDGLVDNIKPDRTDEDLLFQAMLDIGIPLSAKIKQEGQVFYVNDTYVIAYFGRVDTVLLTEMAKKQPYYAVFRDASFVNDSAMVNFEQVFATYSPSTIRRVL